MADDDDRRVEPRGILVGRGLGATPEKIAELAQRAAELDKLSRPKPSRAFSAVMAEGAGRVGEPGEDELSEKEKRRRALPKRGPRPALSHPGQRDVFGREADTDETIVLKG